MLASGLINGLIEQIRDPRDLADQGQFLSLARRRVDDTDDRKYRERDHAEPVDHIKDGIDGIDGDRIRIAEGDRRNDREDDGEEDAVGELDHTQRRALLNVEAGVVGILLGKHGDQYQQTQVGQPCGTLILLHVHLGGDIRRSIALRRGLLKVLITLPD